MTEFLVLIPAVAIYAVVFGYLKFRRILNPIALIVLWWCFWLLLSNFSLTGLYIPSDHTQVRVLGMLLSLILGGLCAASTRRYCSQVIQGNERSRKKWKKILWGNLLFLPVVSYYFIKAIRVLLAYGIFGYRDVVFGSPDEPSILFGNSYIELTYNLFVSPVIFLSLIVSIVLYVCYSEKRVLVLPLLMMVMEAIMRLGRFSFYYVLVFLATSFLLVLQRSKVNDEVGDQYRRSIKKVQAVIVVVILLMGTMVGVLSLIREDSYINVSKTINRFAVGYHTTGFVLFDSELTDRRSRLNTKVSYGRSVLGGLETIGVMFLRRIDPKARSIVQESGTHKHDFQVVGYDENGFPILHNAFYTVLYTLYFDGRDLFIALVPFLFGYTVSASYADWMRRGRIGTLMLLVHLMYLGVFSLFYSPVEDYKFWMVMIALLLVNGPLRSGEDRWIPSREMYSMGGGAG